MTNSKPVIAFSVLAISIVCFILHFVFFRYSFPPVTIDEASFFSPAYSFANHGRLSSDVHKSFLPGAGQYTYWMPPLYMVILGSLLKIIGVTVFNAKLISFLFISAAAILISFISNNRYIKICLSSLLLICPFILITSAFIRMEALAILLIVISMLAVKSVRNEYIMGLVTACLIMTHPMLLPCCAAMGVVMLRRGTKPFLIFLLVTVVVLIPYLLYIFQDIALFKMQMALQFERKSHAHLSDLKLPYLLQSVPVAFIGLVCLYYVKRYKELCIFLTIGISLTLLLVLKSNEFNYQVYLIPYVIACIGLLLEEERVARTYKFILPGFVYVFFVALLVSKEKKYKFLSDKSHDEIISYLDQNKSWNGKNIYVTGNPDVSTFLMMNNQQVERRNAVATVRSSNWFNAYNYIIEVTDNNPTEDATAQARPDTLDKRPWVTWPGKLSYTTSNGSNSITIYSK